MKGSPNKVQESIDQTEAYTQGLIRCSENIPRPSSLSLLSEIGTNAHIRPLQADPKLYFQIISRQSMYVSARQSDVERSVDTATWRRHGDFALSVRLFLRMPFSTKQILHLPNFLSPSMSRDLRATKITPLDLNMARTKVISHVEISLCQSLLNWPGCLILRQRLLPSPRGNCRYFCTVGYVCRTI